MFKEIKRPGDPAKLGEVVSKLEHVPSWMTVSKLHSVDASIVSLKPPKLPSGFGSETGELESVAPSQGPDSAAPSSQDLVANDVDLSAGWQGSEWRPEVISDRPASTGEGSAMLPSIPVPAAVPVIPLPASSRRPDTLFDELIPRADEEAVTAIRDAVQGLLNAREAVLAESESEVIQLARLVAERVIARELSLDPSVVAGLVREGLSALSIKDRVIIRLGPFFEEVCPEVRASISRLGIDAQVEVDPKVGVYGCVIQTEWGHVDESIEQRLRTMLERLSLVPPKPTTARR